ncbi:hypothetical protein CDAR_55981 [Caerostris darwini]|uniref:Uncharacterized protein n=1 Tax=Caerostris darwini TaxID=1538125 RepID=A0AAV4RSS7_9ARAC|nr:hypothetical protein CDAR_55981 [Caerostris darwini]
MPSSTDLRPNVYFFRGRPVRRGNATQTSVDNDGPPPDLITVATLTLEHPHMQDSDTSGSVGGGILNAGDLRVNAVTVSSETTTVDLLPSSNDSDGVSKTEVTIKNSSVQTPNV